jgi:hypothetical protein
MKNPFRKAPMHKLESTIASLTKRSEQLAVKRAATRATLDHAVKARQHALLSADLDDQRALGKVQAAVVSAISDLAGIDDAIAILAQHKEEAERQRAAECERIERAVAAEKLASQVNAIEAALPGFLGHSRALADVLSEIGHWHFESGQMARFINDAMGQVEVAANVTLAELKAMPDAIRQGRQAIPRETVVTPGAVAEPAPAMQREEGLSHIETSPLLREAAFTLLDRSAEARTIEIEVSRT